MSPASTQRFAIRTIRESDNQTLALIIRETLAEFGAHHPGTVYYDESTDHLYRVFQQEGSVYFVVTQEENILGGGGIFPSTGLPDGTCELVKMYLRPEARGHGLGKTLIGQCLQYARDTGYRQVYLESMPELRKALGIYEQFGFRYLDAPLGQTGHFGCAIWMLLDLEPPAGI